MNAETEMATSDGLGGIQTYDPKRVYCPSCRGPAEPGSRNRTSSTHVEYRCASGHGFFSVREVATLADAEALDILAGELNKPGQWNGGDICELAAQLVSRTGRVIEDEPA